MLFISEIAEKVITRCLVDEERDVGVVSKDEVVQHLGSTEVSHTIFVTLILIVTSSSKVKPGDQNVSGELIGLCLLPDSGEQDSS